MHSTSSQNSMTKITRWVLRHKKLVVALWVTLALAGVAAMGPSGNALNDQFSVPGQEAYEANGQILKRYGNGGDSSPLVPVVSLPKGTTVDSPGVTGELQAALDKIERALPGSRIASYADAHDRTFVSKDRRTTFALISIKTAGMEPGQAEARLAQTAVRGLTVGGAPVTVTGVDALRAAAADGAKEGGASLALEAAIAGGGALVVLAFVFASWMAVVPLLMAVAAIPTTFLLVWPLAAATDVSVIVKFLIGLVGLAIAIDYALLVVIRWREERQRAQLDNDDAVVQAMEHAGRAVVLSGTTVAISLLALVILPVPFLRSVGIAGMLIPLVSVAVAITLLPVVLSTIGPRLDRRHARREDHPGRAWTAWARMIVRHRWAAAVVSTAVLGALVFAASTIQLGDPQADSLAQNGPARTALVHLERSGIGSGPLSPFDSLVRSGDPASVADVIDRVEGVAGTVAPEAWRRADSALITVIPTGEGNSPAGRDTLDRIREATHDLEGADVVTGGEAALSADFLDAVYGNFLLVVALIAALTFLLLARAFRSIVLPLKAVILNLLSVGAAWGLMVIIWQHGWGSDAIWGIEATNAINVEMPIIVFAFLFGISMDYQVFILSRMSEAHDRTGSTDEAVVEGIGRTGRLVTSAALILGLAFVAMSTGPGTEAKMFATALGGGILLDATLIRGVLAPSAVAILGRWNWLMPTGAARLLRVRSPRSHSELTADPAPTSA